MLGFVLREIQEMKEENEIWKIQGMKEEMQTLKGITEKRLKTFSLSKLCAHSKFIHLSNKSSSFLIKKRNQRMLF
jgi:hypothetical protein